ncbi:hypothetical protein OHS33_24175 [Streptomyces sp. NBC_00536]|uniref:hypothetical protein n=1 Tax=Streptomyces sp. NBC_00536 TaxID=2975769 RepID=UPI002E80F16D|nr:hypothetical protein [Streptomyces sp. NBC_00536]WUC81159.1 hypothetical protein OHS33_24175 [Streptomyces sp. NBC_00536]
MNTTGTIDRPLTRDPLKQALMTPQNTSEQPSGSAIEDFVTTGANTSRQNRTREMQLIPEALARAHMADRMREVDSERRALRVVAARRMQRRAERGALRARRALAMAVMH